MPRVPERWLVMGANGVYKESDHMTFVDAQSNAWAALSPVLADLRSQVLQLQESMYHDNGAVAMANEVLHLIDFGGSSD